LVVVCIDTVLQRLGLMLIELSAFFKLKLKVSYALLLLGVFAGDLRSVFSEFIS
jgi:hypothetical protein